jgi:hypothetical protein
LDFLLSVSSSLFLLLFDVISMQRVNYASVSGLRELFEPIPGSFCLLESSKCNKGDRRK